MIVLDKYLFRLDKSLFDLNAMEMDDSLADFFRGMEGLPETFEMVNSQKTTRKFTINWDDRTLRSRGIKGFFAPYSGEYLFISKTDDGTIRVSSPASGKNVVGGFSSDGRAEDVLTALANFENKPGKWFQLYELAKDFQFQEDANGEQLLCLPYIRDAQIFNYQVNTIKAILNRFRGRVLLGDEVGLGKTVEAGMAMTEYIMRGLAKKILILTPPSLVQQWENEMKRKFNQDFIKFDGPEFKALGVEAWSSYNKVIASIHTAKRKNHREAIFREHYDLVIVDEAHHLKNRNTEAWKFVNSIQKKYIFLLTATPVQNHLEELYNLITLLKPGQLKTYTHFKKNYVDSADGIEVKNAGKLKNLLADVMIRNKRSNVDVQFTKRHAFTKTIELPKGQLKLYEDISTYIRNNYSKEKATLSRFQLKNLQEQMGSSFHSTLMSLNGLLKNDKLTEFDRAILESFRERAETFAFAEKEGSAKAARLLEIVKQFNDKMIIFTKFKSTQSYLVQLLEQNGLNVAQFHGGLKRMEKEEQVAFFKGGADVLVSTEVGGEGRNLQFCNGMINFDLPWNPMAIEQRIGRIHRIGQERDVSVFNLVAEDTIEYYILELLDRKINMFQLVVGEVDAILGDIEEQEDFSDLMMNAWVNAEDKSEILKELEQIGDKLFENKQKLARQKKLDETLF